MKIVRGIILSILIILIIIISVLYLNGKKLYDAKVAEKPLDEKVQEVRDNEDFTKLSDVPEYYKNAVIAVEDHRYYSHGAIDPIALARALISNIRQGAFKEGGSTITQQTAKNLYFSVEAESGNVVNRKIAELIMSIELESKYSKDEILELYINTIYFGDGYYGIKEACNGYLNKEPCEMNISEATMLAGVPNAPSAYAPTANIDLTRSRQKKVISSMVEYEYLTQEEADKIELYNQ